MINAKKETTLEQLKKIPLLRPANAGSVWQGIKHSDLVDAITDECSSRRWKITASHLTLGKDQADLAGTFQLEIEGIDMPKGQALELGFLTSNAMRRALKLVVGSRVFVCNNGMVSGDIVLCKKHTTKFDLFAALTGACDEYRERAAQVPKLVKSLQQRILCSDEVDHILCEAGRQGIMNWQRIGLVDAEFREPTYAENGGQTSWALLNAFTHIVKRCPPLQQMDIMGAFRELLPLGPS